MRRLLFVLLISALALAQSAGLAAAAAKISVKTDWYSISGRSGQALVDAMDRRGPKHGFMTRAIAQTRYSMKSDAVWSHENGHCRATNARVVLDVTYIFPRVEGQVPAATRKNWARFMKGVERHERMHGRIATQMANAASAAIAKLKIRDDRSCAKSRREIRRRVDAIVEAYEKRQRAFDAIEHQPGGPVDTLLGALRR